MNDNMSGTSVIDVLQSAHGNDEESLTARRFGLSSLLLTSQNKEINKTASHDATFFDDLLYLSFCCHNSFFQSAPTSKPCFSQL
jgi:hypothetical protein